MKMKGILCGFLSVFMGVSLAAHADPAVNIASTSATVSPASSGVNRGNLTVHITGIRNDNGMIRVALFNNAQTYTEKNNPNAADAYSRDKLPIANGEAVWQVSNVPYGVYGIKLFHDEDNSGKLKKNFVGRPTEGVGFSNNPKLGNKAPTFDEVKFNVNQPQNDINIQMINP